jgi:PAS domain S-box-containing protein
VFDFIAKRDLDRARSTLESAIRVGPIGGMIYTLTRADGSEFPAEIAVKVFERDGIRLVIATFKDVTKRINAETLLKESEQKYRHLIEDQTEFISIFNPDTTLTFINDAYSRVLGKPASDLIGTKWIEIVPEGEREKVKGQLMELHLGSDTIKIVNSIMKPDGSVIWTEWVDRGRFDRDGNLISIHSVGRDITERKFAEEALRGSEQRYRSLADSLPEIVFETDINGKLVFANERAFKITGYTKDFVYSHSIFDFIAPQYKGKAIEHFMKTLNNQSSLDNEYTLVRKDGSTFPVIIVNRPVVENERPVGLRGIAIDITERKKMEEELSNYSKKLEQMVEEKTLQLQNAQRLAIIGETATMVGHDLRNPLQSVVNTVYILNKKIKEMPSSPMRDELTRNYERIERNTNYMDKIVSDLLDYARPMVPEFSVTSLQRLINETLADIKVPDNVGITLLFDRTLKIMVDRQLIKRAFTNLIVNAIQAMPDGGVLTITAEDTDKGTYMKFTDTGQGIPADGIKNLFKPFTTNKAKGMGMGLVVVKRIVDAHKGNVDVKSEVGKGTSFAITIPLKQP